MNENRDDFLFGVSKERPGAPAVGVRVHS
jgi:hypothetical protein